MPLSDSSVPSGRWQPSRAERRLWAMFVNSLAPVQPLFLDCWATVSVERRRALWMAAVDVCRTQLDTVFQATDDEQRAELAADAAAALAIGTAQGDGPVAKLCEWAGLDPDAATLAVADGAIAAGIDQAVEALSSLPDEGTQEIRARMENLSTALTGAELWTLDGDAALAKLVECALAGVHLLGEAVDGTGSALDGTDWAAVDSVTRSIAYRTEPSEWTAEIEAVVDGAPACPLFVEGGDGGDGGDGGEDAAASSDGTAAC